MIIFRILFVVAVVVEGIEENGGASEPSHDKIGNYRPPSWIVMGWNEDNGRFHLNSIRL